MLRPPNFPEPIVEVLSEVQEGDEADLVSVSDIDPRMADLEDWEIMLALHHHKRSWDGLITTDSSMLNQPPELTVLLQTNLTLIVAMGAGDDPIKATGLLFAYLGGICARTDPAQRSGAQSSAPALSRRVPIPALVKPVAIASTKAPTLCDLKGKSMWRD